MKYLLFKEYIKEVLFKKFYGVVHKYNDLEEGIINKKDVLKGIDKTLTDWFRWKEKIVNKVPIKNLENVCQDSVEGFRMYLKDDVYCGLKLNNDKSNCEFKAEKKSKNDLYKCLKHL